MRERRCIFVLGAYMYYLKTNIDLIQRMQSMLETTKNHCPTHFRALPTPDSGP